MQRGSFMMTSHDSEPVAVAWQMRVRGTLGSWFSWDSIDQDEYNLYQRSPTSGVEVRALYAAPPAPSSPPGMREAWHIETGKVHTLKTWPVFFNDVLIGRKPFEWRIADRPFEVGDTLVLQEWIPERENLTCKEGRYTGREIRKTVSYLFRPFATNMATVIMALTTPPSPEPAASPSRQGEEK
jgi:hypothetical protein